jgi:hypothetical protein
MVRFPLLCLCSCGELIPSHSARSPRSQQRCTLIRFLAYVATIRAAVSNLYGRCSCVSHVLSVDV